MATMRLVKLATMAALMLMPKNNIPVSANSCSDQVQTACEATCNNCFQACVFSGGTPSGSCNCYYDPHEQLSYCESPSCFGGSGASCS